MQDLLLIDKAFFLKKTPLFKDLDLDLLLTIADKLNYHLVEKDKNIFQPGEEGSRLYFVLDGEVEVVSESDEVLTTLTSSALFGQESLFSSLPRAYLTRTVKQTELLSLSRSSLYTIISECPSVAVAFLQIAHKKQGCLFL